MAEAFFNTAEPAVSAAIKIDLASTGPDAGVFQMRFERDQRCALRLRFVPGLTNTTSQGPCSSRSIDRHRGTITGFAILAFHAQADHPTFVEQQIRDVCVFQDLSTRVARTTQQLLFQLSTAQPECDATGAEPGTRHRGVITFAPIKNSLRELGRTGGEHPVGDTEAFKVRGAFRRDEFATKLCPWKSVLLHQQDAGAAGGEMDCRARAGGSATGNDHIVVELISHTT